MTDGPKAGDVWAYPYLWARQDRLGETEGRKIRPCALAILLKRDDGQDWIFLLAITSKAPLPGRRAIEVPQMERRRAGLDEGRRLWVILDEHNIDFIERSYYLEPGARIGAFGGQFRRQVQNEFINAVRYRKTVRVRRHDD